MPGWCGGASTKWLTEIKIASHDFWVRLNTYDRTMMGPDYPPPHFWSNDEFRFVRPDQMLSIPFTWREGRFTLALPVTLSRQPDLPSNYPLDRGERPVLKAGAQLPHGCAWAPDAGVRPVDVRVNGGAWEAVRIVNPQVNCYTRVCFDSPVRTRPGRLRHRDPDHRPHSHGQPASVAFEKGDCNFSAIPKFMVRAVRPGSHGSAHKP